MVSASLPSVATRPWAHWRALLGRSACAALVALQLLSFVLLLPAYFTLAEHPCRQHCALTIQGAQSLAGAGISPAVYIGMLFGVVVLSVVLSTTLALVLLIRRSRGRMALITAYSVVLLPTALFLNSAPTQIGAFQTTAFVLPPVADLAVSSLQGATIVGLFLLFPSGRFVPRRSWALLVSFVAYTIAWSVWPQLQTALVFGWPLFFGGIAVCIGFRYWRVSSPLEQQQTKWVAFGFVVFLVTSMLYWLPAFSPLGTTVYMPLAYLAYEVLLPIVPITFFIAVQRYRLYDIDVLIRSTLIYGSLTAILAAIYVVGVVVSQVVVGVVMHSNGQAQSPLVIVATTLASAALFQPVRQRIQVFIDRRFYRRKYDAERTLAAFAVALRDEVDLREVTDLLLAAVDETMRPTHVTLWLQHSTQQRGG